MDYEFTKAHPPLFDKGHHNGDVFSIPLDILKQDVGVAQWIVAGENPPPGGGGFKPPRTWSEHTFIATRYFRWLVKPPVVYYTNDVTEKITITTGYTRLEKERFEKTIGLKMGVGGPASMFSAEVNASLKITKETEETWKEELKKERSQTFSKDHTYVHWVLSDIILVEKNSRTRRLDSPGGPWFWPKRVIEQIESQIYFYPDKFKPVLAGISPSSIPIDYERDIKSKRTDSVYNAVCDQVHDGSIGWMGEDRETRDEAEADCEEHQNEFPDHDCVVLEF